MEGRGIKYNMSTNRFYTVFHIMQSVCAFWDMANTIVHIINPQSFSAFIETDKNLRRLAVLFHIGHHFLQDPINRGFLIGG